jgi:hypothetical protein
VGKFCVEFVQFVGVGKQRMREVREEVGKKNEKDAGAIDAAVAGSRACAGPHACVGTGSSTVKKEAIYIN